jgi:hypothetical protein
MNDSMQRMFVGLTILGNISFEFTNYCSNSQHSTVGLSDNHKKLFTNLQFFIYFQRCITFLISVCWKMFQSSHCMAAILEWCIRNTIWTSCDHGWHNKNEVGGQLHGTKLVKILGIVVVINTMTADQKEIYQLWLKNLNSTGSLAQTGTIITQNIAILHSCFTDSLCQVNLSQLGICVDGYGNYRILNGIVQH